MTYSKLILLSALFLFSCKSGFNQTKSTTNFISIDSLTKENNIVDYPILNKNQPIYYQKGVSKTTTRSIKFEYPQIVIYDGIPFENSKVLQNICPDEVQNVSFLKDSVFDCAHKLQFYGLIQINSKDSINEGLKYLFKKTNQWIIKNPLAVYQIDGSIIKTDSVLSDYLKKLNPEMIENIEIIQPNKINCDNGMIKVKTKK